MIKERILRWGAALLTSLLLVGTGIAHCQEYETSFPFDRDAFGRLRVSEALTIFDSKLIADKMPLLWDEALTGGATSVHSTLTSSVTMTVTGGTDSALRRTRMRFNYQPGKSQHVVMTTTASKQSGVTKELGLYDGTNGIILRVTETDVCWVIVKNGSDSESQCQPEWKVDKLDGSGVSRRVLDMSKSQIIFFDYQWLGVGTVRCGFVIDGILIYTTFFHHANHTSGVYSSNPNLPLSYRIVSSGGAGTLEHVCSTVMSEAGFEQNGITHGTSREGSAVNLAVAGTSYAILAVRLKSGYTHATIEFSSLDVLTSSNALFHWDLRMNPGIAGTALTWAPASPAVERALGSTDNVCTGGTDLAQGYGGPTSAGARSEELRSTLRPGVNIAGVADIVAICVTPLSNNQDIYGSLMWFEIQ